MGRRRYPHYFWRRIDKKILGLILLTIGFAIIAVIFLPYSVWMVLFGLALIYAGYKLFIC
ncbi:hypothetical protein [Thermotalea metallivorans]|uniref:Uncharacterized protein n=1 Tax=Thermotalea metallivorans TaxID=520762 RepID=A0A140L618_9FIRM|nr:hypothetical protein [Thermotalea metallivorans]KXG75993.1 hypothetical protein AN619_14570 [Thermotalea metallivorans]